MTAGGLTAVILAAGRSSRMGAQKLLMPVRGTRMIDRVLRAARAYDCILVASPLVARALGAGRRVHVVENTQPDLGMAHSLRLADAAAPAGALLVFLGDKPLVTPDLAQSILSIALRAGADVAFPQRDGVGGHPVYFSAAARANIATVTGDTLQQVRDAPGLRRLAIPIEDEGAYFDVDDPGVFATLDE